MSEERWRRYWKPGEADRFRDAIRAALGLDAIESTMASTRRAPVLPMCVRFAQVRSDGNRWVRAYPHAESRTSPNESKTGPRRRE